MSRIISSLFPTQEGTWRAGLFLWTALALTASLYSLGWAGTWHFDDIPNLSGLHNVFDEGSLNSNQAWQFILTGQAGPLGRPIALASFLIDGSAWPSTPESMLYTNTLIHMLNGALLCGVLFSIGRLKRWPTEQSALIAAFSASLWLLMPLLASSSLMAVQRMTLLSSSFMLLGLWIYLLGRLHLEHAPWRGMAVMAGALSLATLAGAFTKEQAVLLPALILVLEALLLPAPHLSSPLARRIWPWFIFVALVLPTLLIAAFLLRIALFWEGAYALRDFNLPERLWTESLILWEYVRLAFLPRAIEFGPFHEGYPVRGATLATITAAFAWGSALAAGWILRRSSPLPLFAATWFLTAHVLESTVIPLELYFEHRNYLAIVGPVFAMVAGTWLWASKHGRKPLAATLLGLYTLLIAGILLQTTSLFGQPALAAEIWHIQHPDSARAAQYLAQRKTQEGDTETALKVIDRTAAALNHPADLTLQGLQLACPTAPFPELETRLAKALMELPHAPNRFAIIQTLDQLKALHDQDKCQGFLTAEALASIAKAALSNPRIAAMAQNRANLHVFLGTLYIDSRELDNTLYHLYAALDSVTDIETLRLTVATLNSAGLYHEARVLLEERAKALKPHPFLRSQMTNEIAMLRMGIPSVSYSKGTKTTGSEQ